MKNFITILLILVSLGTWAQNKQTGSPSVDSLINEKDSKVLQQKLKSLERGTEKDLVTLMNYYIYNSGKRDSIAEVAIRRFPKSDFAFEESQRNLYREDDAEQKEIKYKKLERNFPERNLDQARSIVAIGYARVKNLSKVSAFTGQIKDNRERGMAIVMSAQEIIGYDAQAAEHLLKPEIERIVLTGVPDEPRAKGNYYAFLNIFGTVLIKNGRYDQALGYVKEVYDHTTRRDDQLSGNYGLVLSKSGRHREALPLLEKLVDDAKADANIKNAFEESYNMLNPGKSAKDYLATIELALKKKMEAEVDKMLISEPAPNFTVKDIDGKSVSLSDFKGKTIVLDFWATWCGPCKKSFPAMQVVVNSYRSNPNVKFLFIHTRETVSDPLTDAKNYLSANNYTFDLYLDLKDKITKKNEAVSAFGAKGIPAKFVIDGKGNIRFKIIGFSGSDDAAIMELSHMIEVARI